MDLLLAFILAPAVLLTVCFAVEIVAGLRPLTQADPVSVDTRSAVIIVPAHNEELILAERLEALKSAASGLARILVVADNCSDSTAEIARAAGVDVLERKDSSRHGKGFALDFAKRELGHHPPNVVLIIDADCWMDAASISNLIAACRASARPCQAINLQQPPSDASATVQLSTFAFFIKNVIRQRALQRLAGRANLLGTGMALPWPIFVGAKLATGSIVEDLKLGQELAQMGHPPLLIEAATVWSNAETEPNTRMQRTRWEGGFIQNALLAGPPMFFRSVASGDLRGVWAAVHTLIPPFALLILMDIAAIILTLAVGWRSRIDLRPVVVLIASLVATFVALTLAWRAGGSRFVSLTALCRAPVYVLWKIPIYVGFAKHGVPQQWQRTERN